MDFEARMAWMDIVGDAISILDEREAEPDPMHWFCSDGDSEAESYCRDCIKELRPSAKLGKDYTYDGQSNMEEDGCETCSRCGKLLAYTLTDWGVEEELNHYSENGFDWENSEQCYELARVAHGASTDDQFARLYNILKSGVNPPATLDL